MIALQPAKPSETELYTERSRVFQLGSNIGMIARQGDRWIVSLHPDDPTFGTQEDAIRFLTDRNKARRDAVNLPTEML
jgi:hypothetical protein